MSLLKLSFKNATVKWWRSVTLGLFIFAISFVMIITSSFISAIKNKVDTVIFQGITGHIQIRSDQSIEEDMVGQYNTGWDALKPLHPATIQKLQKVLTTSFPEIDSHLLVRQSAYLTSQEKREETMLIGIDPKLTTYQEAFLLKEGRYLDPNGTNEILLTEEQAKSFQVKVGETINVTTKNRFGLNSRKDLQVVGIGNFIMLSLFSYKTCYLQDSSVRELIQLDADEATDLLLYLPDKTKVDSTINSLSHVLDETGFELIITKGQKLSSEELHVTSLDLEEDTAKAKLKLSSHQEMGLTFKSAGDIMFITLNIIVFFLMVVVSILIMNLIYMMGIERYREIGTLRAIGFSQFQVIRIFMGEILSISIIFGLVGILVGITLILFFGYSGIPSPIPAMDFIMGKTLFLEIQLRHILLTIAVFTGFSLVASFYPAYRACAVKPAQILRSV